MPGLLLCGGWNAIYACSFLPFEAPQAELPCMFIARARISCPHAHYQPPLPPLAVTCVGILAVVSVIGAYYTIRQRQRRQRQRALARSNQEPGGLPKGALLRCLHSRLLG
jgi:hypothetical protein